MKVKVLKRSNETEGTSSKWSELLWDGFVLSELPKMGGYSDKQEGSKSPGCDPNGFRGVL
jgi:hypothetical protein